MSKNLTMADLLAKQASPVRLQRNQEIEGEVVGIFDQEILLDLGTKAEGVLPRKSLSSDQLKDLKIGSKLTLYVIYPENESGQVVLTTQKSFGKSGSSPERWGRFEEALSSHQILTGRGLELNKGGVIVEVFGVRGFLPSSQTSLSSASNLEGLVGKDVSVQVIEVDPSQNRLIFSQKVTVSDETKGKLVNLKVGDKVKGKVAAILPFGIFVTIEGGVEGPAGGEGPALSGVEGLVHVSELSWERLEDPASIFKAGQELEAKVISVDSESGRVNLSVRQLTEDPFKALAEKYKSDNVVKGEVTKVGVNGVAVKLPDGAEATLPSAKMDSDTNYEVGQKINFLIDAVDINRHKITLAPFVTSTKDLIYK